MLTVILHSAFRRTTKLFPSAAVSNIRNSGFQFFYSLSNGFYFLEFFHTLNLVDVSCNITVVMICSFLLTNGAQPSKHMPLALIYISSLEKNLSKILT
jgi:hypothetical protein